MANVTPQVRFLSILTTCQSPVLGFYLQEVVGIVIKI
jgi:hypothetical protein